MKDIEYYTRLVTYKEVALFHVLMEFILIVGIFLYFDAIVALIVYASTLGPYLIYRNYKDILKLKEEYQLSKIKD